MDVTKIGVLVLGVLLGGAGVWLLGKPALRDVDLVEGRYLVFHSDYGNWVYDRQDDGTFKPMVKELSPLGLKTIWGLQSDYKPTTFASPKGEVLYLPYTSYSTDTGAFNTTHKFFQMTDLGLVEVPLTTTPTPPTGR